MCPYTGTDRWKAGRLSGVARAVEEAAARVRGRSDLARDAILCVSYSEDCDGEMKGSRTDAKREVDMALT